MSYAVTATQVITQGFRDVAELRANQGAAADLLNDALIELNQFIDELAQQRRFVYKSDGTTFTAFADLTTSYTLAAGFARMLRKNLAVRMMPMLVLYLKGKPELDQVKQDAAEALAALDGVGAL
jgi:hypothetical protein